MHAVLMPPPVLLETVVLSKLLSESFENPQLMPAPKAAVFPLMVLSVSPRDCRGAGRRPAPDPELSKSFLNKRGGAP